MFQLKATNYQHNETKEIKIYNTGVKLNKILDEQMNFSLWMCISFINEL